MGFEINLNIRFDSDISIFGQIVFCIYNKSVGWLTVNLKQHHFLFSINTFQKIFQENDKEPQSSELHSSLMQGITLKYFFLNLK